MQHSGASNVSCDSEVFSSRWRESVCVYSEASIGRAATVSRQVPLWVPLIPGEEGGKEGRSGGSEWVSAARLVDAVFFQASVSSPGVFVHIVDCMHSSVSEHFCPPV